MKYEGNVYTKLINGKVYYYQQYRHNGKMVSKSISALDAYDLSLKIRLQNEGFSDFCQYKFKTKVIYGNALFDSVNGYKQKNKRYCYAHLEQYLKDNEFGKVFVLYGLRRTGKTTLMFQTIDYLPIKEFSKAAYILINEKDTFEDLMDDLNHLTSHGFKYIYIDEITLINNFISMSSTLSDFYGLRSKIILSGTDSLGFLFAKHNELFDRAIIEHTTFISFKEFSEVLGIDSIDKYFEYGGVLSISGFNYNNRNSSGYNEYVDTAIAHNIIHSLKLYGDGDHFASLYPLYEKGELVDVINRIVEDRNHRFAIEVISRSFKSHDYGSLKDLIKKSLNTDVMKAFDDVDEKYVNNALMEALDIINKNYKNNIANKSVIKEIEQYLDLLDMCKDVDEANTSSWEINKKKVVIQPGLRFAQAKELLNILMNEPSILKLPLRIRKIISDKLLNDIKGRMLEEIVLYQSSLSNKNTFKLLFPIGEYDMVTYDNKTESSDIYEIKYSDIIDDRQYKYLDNKDMNDTVTRAYYPIKNRIVIYRGISTSIGDINYINVEEYLKGLVF